MKAFLFIASCFLFYSWVDHHVAADHTELCRLLKNGTKFRRPGTCSDYITCTNSTGRVYTCTTPTMFDRNKQACVDTLSECDTNYCKGVNGKWVANPDNCQGFYYCSNSVAYPGECKLGYHFDESSQLCVFGDTSGCDMVPNLCTFLPDKSKFRDDNDCTVYYECSNGKKSKKTCKNTYFDVESGTCVSKTLVPCTTHPMPNNVCGTAKKPSPGYKTDAATCRGFFFCRNLGIVQDLEPIWGQCPENTFFNTTTQSCVNPVNAYCPYNRCEGRPNMMVTTSTNDCHSYLICENGFPVAEKKCSGDKFFDELKQACVNTIVDYPCCDGRK